MKKFCPLFLFMCIITFSSCSSDEGMLDVEQEIIEDSDLIVSTARSNQPCDFDISNIDSNSTLKISCLLDLNDKTIQLPSNVKLEFDGGDIINGTLKFSGGKIDQRLLSSNLTIKGNVQLDDSVFEFDPSRWDIQQGEVSDRVALKNKNTLENLIEQVKEMGADKLKIGEFDAYFEVVSVTLLSNPNFYPWIEAINIPNNFTLEMSDNTHLRVQPNNSPKYSLLAIYNTSNSSIIGGNLHGDRDEHKYYGWSSHEWGHVITLHGANDAKVVNVKMMNGSGDGMKIESDKFTWDPDYTPSRNVQVTGCTFDNNRRNNLSITGGQDLIIENSTFLRAGANSSNSKGTNPRYQIDIEAHRKRENGIIKFYEKVDGVIIRNNIEKDGSRGGFLVSIGDNVTIDGNTTEKGITYNYANGTVIKNNIITAPNNNGVVGIKGGTGDTETISNNKIYGNTVSGFDTGIMIYSQDHKIYDNNILDCLVGLSGKNILDSEFTNNTITSSRSGSQGIFFHVTTAQNVEFKENIITTDGNPFSLNLLNRGFANRDYEVKFVGNEFNSEKEAFMFRSFAINMVDNKFNGALEVRDSRNLRFDNNTFDASDVWKHATEWRDNSAEIKLTNNDFISKLYRKAIKKDATINSDVFIDKGGNSYRRK